MVLFAHFGSGMESVIFQSTTWAELITPPHENAPGSNPVTASDLKQGFGDFFSAAFARCIDLDQLTWLSADVRGLYCPICQLPRRFHLELFCRGRKGKRAWFGTQGGCAIALPASPPAFMQPGSKVKYSAIAR
jgi:hypothetical protein